MSEEVVEKRTMPAIKSSIFGEVCKGKYGKILLQTADTTYKQMQATVALANEDGERNRLLRIQLAIELAQMSEEQKYKVEQLIQDDLNLVDLSIE